MIFPVILAGGKGERFWPQSREKRPKQFLNLIGEESLLQLTVKRLSNLVPFTNTFIVTGQNYVGLVQEQLPQLPVANIIVEPMGKNTAACTGLAAVYLERINPEGVMVVLPSDHLVGDSKEFLQVVKAGIALAQEGDFLITMGITPSHPETGYGYINYGEEYGIYESYPAFSVRRFVEKPDLQTAKEYLESGEFLWNSGMFIWKVSTILKKIEKYMPDLFQAVQTIKNSIGTRHEKEVLFREYCRLESISLDYGIMELSDHVFVFPGNFGWDDIGSWTSLSRIKETDDKGNVFGGNVVEYGAQNCIVESSEKLIGVIGAENLIIVESDDAFLVCSKEHAQDIKGLLQKLKQEKKVKYL